MTPQPDTQQRILDAARELIFSRSYADVGVAAICDQAGVQKGSFYHFYPSKQALSLAILDAYYSDFKHGIIDQAFIDSLAPMTRFDRLGELLYQFQRQIFETTGHVPGCPFGNLAVEMATQDEPIRCKAGEVFSNTERVFTKALDEAVARHDIEPINTTATAQAILAYMEGVMLLAKTRNDPEVIKQLGQAVSAIRIPLTE